jgi:hypothetical protein
MPDDVPDDLRNGAAAAPFNTAVPRGPTGGVDPFRGAGAADRTDSDVPAAGVAARATSAGAAVTTGCGSRAA